MTNSRYLTAAEVAHELDVSRATVYAYVSRGLIRSEPVPGDGRARRYYREDVERLNRRKDVRRNPTQAGEQALHWGTPVLESALTLIADGRLYYRGRDVLALAESASVEEAAALLWAGDANAAPALFDETGRVQTPANDALRSRWESLPPVDRLQAVLPLIAAHDVAGFDLRPAAVQRTGARILTLLTRTATGTAETKGGVAATLQHAWSPDDPGAADTINAALILCADHELNVSSFTARCVASAGATPYAVVQAALAALTGVKHGGVSERVEAFFNEVDGMERVATVVTSRLRRGEPIWGFGHPLYPEGDPRAAFLLARLREQYPGAPALALSDAIIETVRDIAGVQPNVDFALVTLRRTLGLPAGTALALFAIGRTVGWIAHAIEQYHADQLIRPRARYVGEMPES